MSDSIHSELHFWLKVKEWFDTDEDLQQWRGWNRNGSLKKITPENLKRLMNKIPKMEYKDLAKDTLRKKFNFFLSLTNSHHEELKRICSVFETKHWLAYTMLSSTPVM